MLPGHVQRTRSTSTNSSGDCAPRALSRRRPKIRSRNCRVWSNSRIWGSSNGETPARRAAEPAVARAEPLTSIETEALRPTLDDEVEELAPGASEADRAARRDYEFDAHHSDGASAADAGEERRPMRWKLAVSALALAGVAMIGAVFALRGGVPGLKKDPPFIAAAQGPTKVAPPSDQTVTTSSDAGATLLKDNGKPAPVKVVNSEEQPVDLNAQASVNNPPPAVCRSGQAARGRNGRDGARRDHQYAARRAAGRRAAAGDDVGIPRPETGAHDLAQAGRNADRRPSPPDQPASDANVAPRAGGAAKQAGRSAERSPAPKTTSDAAGVAQPSTPKIELPTKLSPPKSSARVVVGKTDTTAPDGDRPDARRTGAKRRSGETGEGGEEAEGRASRRRDRDDGSDRAACRRHGRDHLGRMVGSARRAQVGGRSQEHDDTAEQQVRRRTQRLRHRRA